MTSCVLPTSVAGNCVHQPRLTLACSRLDEQTVDAPCRDVGMRSRRSRVAPARRRPVTIEQLLPKQKYEDTMPARLLAVVRLGVGCIVAGVLLGLPQAVYRSNSDDMMVFTLVSVYIAPFLLFIGTLVQCREYAKHYW